MYNTPYQVKNLRMLIIATGSFLLLATIVWFIATYGIIRVAQSSLSGEYQLGQAGEDETENIAAGSWKIVKNGTYTIEYIGDDAQIFKNVEVPNFLRTATVSFAQEPQKQVVRVAAGVLTQIVNGADSQIISTHTVGETDSLLIHPASDPTGIKAAVRQIPPSSVQSVNNNKLFAFTGWSENDYQLTPAVYDPLTGQYDRANKTYSGESSAQIVSSSTANNDMFGVYGFSTSGWSLDVFNGTELLKNISLTGEVATGSGDTAPKIIGVSDSFVALGFGDDFSGATVDYVKPLSTQEPPEPQEFIARIYDINTAKEVSSISLGKTNTVANMQITNDGKYLSVVVDNTLTVFDVASKEQVFEYRVANVVTPQWIDNNRLIFGSAANSIFELNVQEKTASSLFAPGKLQINSFTVVGNDVLFSAFSNLNNSGSSIPDGYVVKLQTKAVNDNALVRHLPYTSDALKVVSLNETIYAAEVTNEPVSMVDEFGDFLGPEFRPISPSETFKGSVNDYLQKNVPNYQQYNIVYGVNL